MEWQEISGNWVLIPKHSIGIIHFLGGAFVATIPQITYRWLLEELAKENYAIVATPFINTLDHIAIAKTAHRNFENTVETVRDRGILRRKYLPIYGMGHSMGCKLHLLIGSMFNSDRSGNIFISFNNYAASESIPLLEQLKAANLQVEFTPNPMETKKIVEDDYKVRRNLLVKFTNDTIDQTSALNKVLKQKFPDMIAMQILPGTHVTPLGQDIINWETGKEFSAFDAVGQWFKQEVLFREINLLKKEILRWLQPF
jgi:Protein of unknown function (DUF1350)